MTNEFIVDGYLKELVRRHQPMMRSTSTPPSSELRVIQKEHLDVDASVRLTSQSVLLYKMGTWKYQIVWRND